MNGKTKTACPACEYERNSHGQPIEKDGEMQCLDCGSTWRVLETLPVNTSSLKSSLLSKSGINRFADPVSLQIAASDEAVFSSATSFFGQSGSYKPGFGTMMSCIGGMLLFAGLYLSIAFLEKGSVAIITDKLYIAEVEMEEQVRHNGQKVFTVKGLVSNPTDLSKPIPPIAIILRKQNGSEITRWHYTSSLASLRAGGKSRFASSIQYDTPIVAYAEAVFK